MSKILYKQTDGTKNLAAYLWKLNFFHDKPLFKTIVITLFFINWMSGKWNFTKSKLT